MNKPKTIQCPVCAGKGLIPVYHQQPGLRGEWEVIGADPCPRCEAGKQEQSKVMRPVSSEWVEEWTP